jgi:uncharacterized protein DUF1629
VDVLGDYLTGNGELLPLECEESGPFYCFNCLMIADVLDMARTEVKFFPSNPKKIMRIVKHVFREERLVGLSVFRLAQYRAGLYVTDVFRQRVREAGLTGFKFLEPDKASVIFKARR